MNFIDRMDEIFNLFLTLDRQIMQENYKQAYIIARTLSYKIAELTDDLYMQMLKKETTGLNPLQEAD